MEVRETIDDSFRGNVYRCKNSSGFKKRSVFSQPSVIMENSRIKIVSKKLSNRIKDGIKEVKPIKSEKDQ